MNEDTTTTGPGIDLVVVTGLHRSGTTFLASILDAAADTEALGVEPLNVTWGLRLAAEWYPKIVPGDVIDVRLQRVRRGIPVGWKVVGDDPLERIRSWRRGQRRNLRVFRARRNDLTLIVKDPFLSLSLPYAATLTSRPVVISMRHPAAWAMSLQRVDWHPAKLLADLRARDDLTGLFDDLEVPDRRWADVPVLEAGAWTWLVLTAAIERQRETMASPTVLLPLEEFATDPLERGLGLIDDVGLRTDDETASAIAGLTLGSTVVPETSTTHVLQRDTKASVSAWRERLSSDEQQLVWNICAPVASRYYSLD